MSLAEAIALRVEQLLKENNLTQYKLSKLSGVSQTTISEIRSKKNLERRRSSDEKQRRI